MNIIKAIEDFAYFHQMTGQSKEQWEKWRAVEAEEWKLNINMSKERR